MTKRKRKNQFNSPKFCQGVRKRYRKRFKKGVNASDGEIMKVIYDYLEYVMDEVIKGKKVMLGKHSYIQVVGVPVLEHASFVNLSKQGLVLSRAGIRKAKGLSRRKDFVYGIKYENTLSKEKIYFDPHPMFSMRVHKALEETNTYFHIVTKNCNKKDDDKIINKTCN